MDCTVLMPSTDCKQYGYKTMSYEEEKNTDLVVGQN